MPVHHLPQTPQSWRVSYGPDGTGDIVRTFQVNMTMQTGKIVASRRIQPHTVDFTDVNDPVPSDYVFTNADGTERWWKHWDDLWKTAAPQVAFVQDTLTDSPSGEDGDLAVFGRTIDGVYDRLVATNDGTDLALFDRDISTTTWTDDWWTVTLGQPALESAYPTILQRFQSNSQDLLLVGNNNVIHSIDLQNNVVYNRLVFLPDFEVNWIKVTKDRVYAGFKNKDDVSLPSYVVEYDPFTESSNPVIANNGESTGFIYENICHIVDIKGWISRFNANGFTPIAAFPTALTDGMRFAPVHRNGIALIDDRPHFLMIGKVQFFAQILPAGVWCWDPATNSLTHKGSGTQSDSAQEDFGAATLGGNAPGTSIARYGALFPLGNADATVSQDFFAGMVVKIIDNDTEVYTGTFSTVVVAAGPESMPNRGWIVTPKLYSRDINAIWRNIVAQYAPAYYPFGRQAGSIVVKYRTSDPIDNASTFDSGTWTSATTFNVSVASTPNMEVGDEIFILSGRGAGLSAHITAMSGAVTRSVTIDESFPAFFGGFSFVYENWRKLTDETYTDGLIDNPAQNGHQFDIPENEDAWIQLKIEIRTAGTTPFRGFALEELGVGYQENLRQEGGQRDRSS